MNTREALRQMTGRTHMHGDGPLQAAAALLLQGFDQRQAALMAGEDRRHIAQTAPALSALRRHVAEMQSEQIFDNSLPLVSRFEAWQALRQAQRMTPDDRGLRLATAHLKKLWASDKEGALAVGDVARVRAHYAREFPRSRVAAVIDAEIPKVSFSTLDVRKMAQLASSVVDQSSYEEVVHTHGLASRRPEHFRARAFIRGLAETTADRRKASMGGEDAARRALLRMATYDDPILRTAQLELEEGPLPEDDMLSDESVEEVVVMEHPLAGDDPSLPDLEVSVRVIEEEPSELGMEPGGLSEPAEPSSTMMNDQEAMGARGAGLTFVADLDAFDEVDEDLGDMDEGLDDFGGDAVAVETITDPAGTGELEISISAPEESPMSEPGGPLPDQGAGDIGANAPGAVAASRQTFAVYAVRDGVRHTRPLEVLRVPSMQHALARVSRRLRHVDGGRSPQREVRARSGNFERQAWVVLDDAAHSYFVIEAEGKANFNPTPNTWSNGQPTVRHNVDIDKDDGEKVLLGDEELKQNAPKALTAAAIKQACAELGLTRAKVEARVLADEVVEVAGIRLASNDFGDIVLSTGAKTRTASLMDLDSMIGQFMRAVAAKVVAKGGVPAPRRQTQVQAEPQRRLAFEVRPLFTVGCSRCGSIAEYLMPDRPENVRCGHCAFVTPKEAVSIQLEARGPRAFPGYIVTAHLPVKPESSELKLYAKQVERAIRGIDGVREAAAELGLDGSLAIQLRQVDEATIDRIAALLEQRFGGRNVMAMEPPAVSSQGLPTQHMTAPMQPDMSAREVTPMDLGLAGNDLAQRDNPMPTAAIGADSQVAAMDTAADVSRPMYPKRLEDRKASAASAASAATPQRPTVMLVEYEDAKGTQSTMPIQASSRKEALRIFTAYDPNLRVRRVRAQLDSEMAAPTGADTQQEMERLVEAAMTTYKAEEMSIDQAIDEFVTKFKRRLDRFGEGGSPSRQMIGASVVRIAMEVYRAARMSEAKKGQLLRVAAGMPTPGKVPAQHPPNKNKGITLSDKSLGQHSDTDPSVTKAIDYKGKPSATHDPAKNKGVNFSDGDLGEDSEGRDPKSFGAYGGGGPSAEHPPTDQKGVKLPGTDMGKDSDTGDNKSTKKWDSVSKAGPGAMRSK